MSVCRLGTLVWLLAAGISARRSEMGK